jgi:hypothetical protein
VARLEGPTEDVVRAYVESVTGKAPPPMPAKAAA